MRKDYNERRLTIAKKMGWEAIGLDQGIINLYVDNLKSADQIALLIKEMTDQSVTPRSIQRLLRSAGVIRTNGDAFRLAVSQGRVNFAYKRPEHKARRHKLGVKARYQVLSRDGYKCVLCGGKGEDNLLEVDHIVARVHGGSDELENLRTLCNQCNVGKRVAEGER